MPNKVKYNLKNVHYALLTYDQQGQPQYGTPVAIPGAVNLSLSHTGDPENFYADGVAYYVVNNNMGYDGDLEIALIPESFRKDALNETLDGNNVLIENSDAQLAPFALLFEFDGDQKHIRHVMYNCTASRPDIEGQTNEESKTPQTEKVTLKCTPLSDGYVKGKTGDTTDAATYNGWYTAVHLPATADATLSALTIGSLALTPTFSSSVVAYTATATNASDTVFATATATGATVEIKVNGSTVASGGTATWNTGNNTVVATCTNGTVSKAYTVTVTKGE